MKIKFPLLVSSLLAMAFAGLMAWSAWGGIVAYTYDSAGRLVSGTYAAKTNFVYAYDNSGNLLLSSAPVPALTVSPPAGGQVTLAWPASPAGFVLQQSSTVGAGASWTSAGVSTTQSGNFLTATVPVGSTAVFYRLHK